MTLKELAGNGLRPHTHWEVNAYLQPKPWYHWNCLLVIVVLTQHLFCARLCLIQPLTIHLKFPYQRIFLKSLHNILIMRNWTAPSSLQYQNPRISRGRLRRATAYSLLRRENPLPTSSSWSAASMKIELCVQRVETILGKAREWQTRV